MSQMPRSLSSRSVRARLTTAMNGTDSAAPAATLRTMGVRPVARSRGAMTAVTRAASAVRRHAPRLCGSWTPSRINSSGGPAAVSSATSRSRLRIGRARGELGDDPLVPAIVGEPVEQRGIGRRRIDAVLLREPPQLLEPLARLAALDPEPPHAIG